MAHRKKRNISLAVSAVFAAALASRAAGQEVRGGGPDFSETRFREGKEAYAAHRFVEAIDQLRIAAFGFLERPALLCESLVYLALADEAAERHTEAKAAVERLSDVERRFPACAEAKLDPAVRGAFELRFRWRPPGSSMEPSPRSAQTARPQAATPTPRPPG